MKTLYQPLFCHQTYKLVIRASHKKEGFFIISGKLNVIQVRITRNPGNLALTPAFVLKLVNSIGEYRAVCC